MGLSALTFGQNCERTKPFLMIAENVGANTPARQQQQRPSLRFFGDDPATARGLLQVPCVRAARARQPLRRPCELSLCLEHLHNRLDKTAQRLEPEDRSRRELAAAVQ